MAGLEDDDGLRAGDGAPFPRPGASQRWVQKLRGWIEWIGPWRLAGSAVATLAMAAGAWWLVRAPSPPAETLIPYASNANVTAPPGAAIGSTGGTLAPSPTAPALLTVHVAGAVARPGVYTLPAGSRVDDAVAAAGGVTRRADIDAVNLAAPAVDGAQVYMPEPGEAVALPPPSAAVDGSPGDSTPIAASPVDLNTAALDELDTLPGVGPATATAIIQYRDEYGPFVTVDDLDSVPGIGPAKLDAVRDLVTV